MGAHSADYEQNTWCKTIVWPAIELGTKHKSLFGNNSEAESACLGSEEIFNNFCPNLLRIREYCNLSVIFTAKYYDVQIHELMSRTRANAQAAQARQIAVYLAHTLFSVSYRDVALYFRRDRTTVAYACRVIEDHRDSRIFDEKLSMVEEFLSEAAVITEWVGYEYAQSSPSQRPNEDCYL